MGQQEIYDILKSDKKKWFTKEEIYDKIPNSSTTSIYACIRRLIKTNFVKTSYRKLKIPKKTGRDRTKEFLIRYNPDD